MSAPLSATQVDPSLVQSVFRNVDLRMNGGSTVQLAAGAVIGASAGRSIMTTTAPLVANVTITGIGGLDTGSEAADTWYYIYLLRNPNDGDLQLLLSASESSPTLPGAYTQFRLIGAVYNNSSSDFVEFVQHGRAVSRTAITIFSGASLGTVSPTGSTQLSVATACPHLIAESVWGYAFGAGVVDTLGSGTRVHAKSTVAAPSVLGSHLTFVATALGGGTSQAGGMWGPFPLVDDEIRASHGSPTNISHSVTISGWYLDV